MMNKNISDYLSNIDAFLFKYKKEAQEKYNVDNKEHFGVMAQQLEENPITEKAVITDETDGHKEIDIKELTIQNTAMLADIVRRVQKLEEKIGDLK